MYHGTVYMPSPLWRDKHPADMLSIFTEELAATFGWKTLSGGHLDISDVEGSVLFVIKAPQAGHPRAVEGIGKLSKNIKLVSYFQDIHGMTQSVTREIMDRSDLIITAYRDVFYRKYPQYKHKTVYIPAFIAPAARYLELPLDRSIDKCLITGSTIKDFYPLRYKAATSRSRLFSVVKHPGYNGMVGKSENPGVFVGDKYAKLLNAHSACLTCVSINEYVVCKLFEIMAAGSLLVCNKCDEMDDLGFRDGFNYIRVDERSYLRTVKDIITHSKSYGAVAARGRELVAKGHTLDHAMASIMTELTQRGIVNWMSR
jgi:hypothetical protein